MTETATTKKELVRDAYVVLSIADLRQLLKLAKANRKAFNAQDRGNSHCIALGNLCVNRVAGEPQISSSDIMIEVSRQLRNLNPKKS